ncbi:MAG: hypothetical protein CSA20_00285 [Deltaproteobacteria bacterium]|nr:MAG: hypothetical protein CSA20_00285 [Deltaproteobacteria bacterium]
MVLRCAGWSLYQGQEQNNEARLVFIEKNIVKPVANQRGLALLVVLWVMAVLTVIVGQYSYGVRNETNSTRNFRDGAQAYYLARAGVYRGIELLLDDAARESGPEKEPLLFGVPLPAESLGNGHFSVVLEDLSGRINLNLATRELLELLPAGLDLDEDVRETIVDSIEDWRDEDNMHRLFGAEDAYYNALPEPYDCADGAFFAPGDLLFVKGVSKELYQVMAKRITVFPLKEDFRVSRERRLNRRRRAQDVVMALLRKPQQQVNINSAPREVLQCLPGISAANVAAILEARKEKAFTSLGEVQSLFQGEGYAQAVRFITLKSGQYYSITSVGSSAEGDVERAVTAIVHLDREEKQYTIVSWHDNAVMVWE